MAASIFRKSVVVCQSSRVNSRLFHSFTNKKSIPLFKRTIFLGVPCTCVAVWQAWKRIRDSELVPKVYAARKKEPEEKEGPPSTYRELRFRQFASVQYEGVMYMTPQDFLESVTEETPRHKKDGLARIGQTKLDKKDLDSWLRHTPMRKKGSNSLFRSMHDKGIISYTEYLFLLCVLTKPQSGFRIAFNMFDTDGNQIVDKKEFLVLESFFILPPHERKFVPREKKDLQKLLDLESVFSKQRDTGDQSDEETEKKYHLYGRKKSSIDPIQDTSLLIHFFGKKGNDVLKYEDFCTFMENLQSEVIELEFLEFSRGMQTISEEDFARILLRYTNLDNMEVDECIERVRDRMPEEKGITFPEFKQFCQFMNSLDDFTIAMNMYTYAEQPVSREQFQRAVKICTGFTLESHIVTTVFNIFDVDGDGHLSYKEFISIMKDRKHRGSKSSTMHTPRSWEAFKSCVKSEMKSY